MITAGNIASISSSQKDLYLLKLPVEMEKK
jgi:hypothetical protein